MKKSQLTNFISKGPLTLAMVFSMIAVAYIGTPAAHAQNGANADAVYNGWLNAYLIRSGGKTYFANNLQDRSMAFMWGQAYMITNMCDAYDRTPSAANKQLVSDLLNTFIGQNTTDLSWDSWNDDVAWATIALVRGYQITGNAAFLNAATQAWNMAYNRGWDSTYGGGIWENMDNVPSGGKGGLSNWPFVISGCFIYQFTGDVNYLNKCQSIYAWARSHAYDPGTGRVNEGWNPSGRYGDDNSYNSGLLVNAANALYKLTGNAQYYGDAQLAASHCIGKFGNGIMTEDHPANGGFGCEQFARGLSLFARQNNLWNTYWQFLENNCASSWNNRRTDYNVTWNNFGAPTPAGQNFWGMEVEGSVVIQLVTQINPIAGEHTIFNKGNGLVIDNASTNTQGAGMIQWAWNRGNAQKWIFTQNSDTSWNIVSKYSGQALDNANSLANGAQVIQWGANSANNNQRWWVDQQPDGSYKIWSKASSLALDNNNSNANNAKLIQWSWNNTDNQKWYLK